jgi:hypothetical protein
MTFRAQAPLSMYMDTGAIQIYYYYYYNTNEELAASYAESCIEQLKRA